LTHDITDDAAIKAGKFLRNAAEYFAAIERHGDLGFKHIAIGYLQDGLAELGFDLVPLKQQPTATADAIFDDAAFNYGRGGV
jgi:hypothetical protein